MLIMDCSAVMALLTMTALAVYRSPASPYADSDPHSELMMTNGMPARARARRQPRRAGGPGPAVTQAGCLLFTSPGPPGRIKHAPATSHRP